MNRYAIKPIVISLLIMSMTIEQVQSVMSLKKTAYLLATGASIAGVGYWAYSEHTNKQRLQIELDKLNSERFQVEQDEQFLAQVGEYSSEIEREYTQEIHLLKAYSMHLSNDTIDALLKIMQARLRITQTYSVLATKLEQQRDKAIAYQKELEIKLLSWHNNQNKQKYIEHIQEKLLPRVNALALFLQSLYAVLLEQKSFIELNTVLAQDYERLYDRELVMYEHKDTDVFARNLETHVRVLYARIEEQFPFLSYADAVKKDVSILKHAVEKLSYMQNLTSYQALLKKRADQIIQILDYVLHTIVNTEFYTEEKRRKPEYDLQQQRLQAELRERQARIENDKRLTEAKILKQKNKTQELIVKQAENERARKELEIRDQNIRLELARIRDGQTVREAVAQKHKEWQDYTERTTKDHEQQLITIRNDLEHAKIEARNISHDFHAAQSEIAKLRDTIRKTEESLTVLENKLSHPPFNPESVDGLRDYLATLTTQVHVARATCLS